MEKWRSLARAVCALALVGAAMFFTPTAGIAAELTVSERLRAGYLDGFRLGGDIKLVEALFTDGIREDREGGRLVGYSGYVIDDDRFLKDRARVSVYADLDGVIYQIIQARAPLGEVSGHEVERGLARLLGPPTKIRQDESGGYWIRWDGEDGRDHLLAVVTWRPQEGRTNIDVSLTDKIRDQAVTKLRYGLH